MSPNPPPPEPRGQEIRQQRPHAPREHPTARCQTQALWIAGSYTVFTRSSAEPSAHPPIRRKHPMHPERTSACPAGSEKRRANSEQLPSNQCRPTRPRRSRVDRKSDNKDPIRPENTPTPGAERRRFGAHRSSTEASDCPTIRRKHPMHPERTAARPAGSEKLRAHSVQLPSKQCHPTHPRRSRVDRKPDNKDPPYAQRTPHRPVANAGALVCWELHGVHTEFHGTKRSPTNPTEAPHAP